MWQCGTVGREGRLKLSLLYMCGRNRPWYLLGNTIMQSVQPLLHLRHTPRPSLWYGTKSCLMAWGYPDVSRTPTIPLAAYPFRSQCVDTSSSFHLTPSRLASPRLPLLLPLGHTFSPQR